ncbi:MAG: DNRLRE domain-containing protein [Oscillospiraceae bacterium]|nr:DNRLRE domain-containing protein [Oscillospiraceae bacterium]
MKKLNVIVFAALFAALGNTLFAQTETTVVFKPGPAIGQDAMVMMNNPSTSCSTWVSTNYGNYVVFFPSAWTWNGSSCGEGWGRGLLKFDELSTIPTDATIISAELKLYGVPSNASHPHGNSSYPGGPSTYYSNPSSLYKVMSSWDEQTVAWNTQPSIASNPTINIPPTDAQWNWNFTTNSDPSNSVNLQQIVQEWVQNPAQNFGFMLKLNTEIYYRGLLFASSDHSDPNLWPELIVTYEACESVVIHDTVTIPQICPCEANFSYTVNTAYPYSYSFMASNYAVGHHWLVNGNQVSTAPSFTYDFPNGHHTVCYFRILKDIKCDKCITFCVENKEERIMSLPEEEIKTVGESANLPELKKENKPETAVMQGTIPPGDVIVENNSKIKVYPNPTTKDWTVEITAEKEEKIQIQLSDMTGKIVYADSKTLTDGYNRFIITAHSLVIGNYNLQITGKTVHFSDTLLKQ